MDFKIEDRESYLYVRVSDSFDLEEAKRCLTEALDTALELGIPKLLINSTAMTGSPTVWERYAIGEYIAGKNIEYYQKAGLASLQIAAVGVAPTVEPGRLSQLVARNRAANIIVTDDMAEAMAWLGVA